MKSGFLIILRLFWVGLLSTVMVACSESRTGGNITGTVYLPKEIALVDAPQEAKIYVYLKDYSPKNGEEVPPWEAPIRAVVVTQAKSIVEHKVPFEFEGVPEGAYGVSVLVDTGRPHVPDGSRNFTAYPGDYAGGTGENISIEEGETVEVSVKEGLYVSIPDGYQAPLFSPD